jgi:hypothetical protein
MPSACNERSLLTSRRGILHPAVMDNERSTSVRFSSRSRLRVAGAVLAAVALVALLVVAFSGSGTKVAPRDLPLAVTGGDKAAAAVGARLQSQVPGGFTVVAVSDAAAAEALIRDREVYGALVTQGPAVSEVLVASAASPAVAQVLTGLSRGFEGVRVRDVVAAPPDDPRGAGLAGGALPITIGGILTGALAALLVSRRSARAGVIVTSSLTMGAVLVTVLHGMYGSLVGNPWLEWAAASSGVGAIGLVLVGSYALGGRAALVGIDLLLIMVGNPFSAATSAPELLPQPWGSIGHSMPLGSTVDLLRGISGFDAADTLGPWLGLAGWAAAGIVLMALAAFRRRLAPHPDSGASGRPGEVQSADPVGLVAP